MTISYHHFYDLIKFFCKSFAHPLLLENLLAFLAAFFSFNDDFLSSSLIYSDFLATLFAYFSFSLKSADILLAFFDFNDNFLSISRITSDSLADVFAYILLFIIC